MRLFGPCASFPLLLDAARAICAASMADEESSKSKESGAPEKRPRARRSRRGGRGRGRGRKTGSGRERTVESQPAADAVEPTGVEERIEASEPAAEEMPIADSPIEEARHEAADESFREQHPHAEEPEPYSPAEPAPEHREPARPRHEAAERRDFRPAAPQAIADAIAEVNHVIASLRQVLDEMEEVLETLELAEVQKNADEREIQSLRNALRQMERRGGGEPRHEQHGHGHSQRPESRRGRH